MEQRIDIDSQSSRVCRPRGLTDAVAMFETRSRWQSTVGAEHASKIQHCVCVGINRYGELKTGLTHPFLGMIGGSKEVEAGCRVSFLLPIFLGRSKETRSQGMLRASSAIYHLILSARLLTNKMKGNLLPCSFTIMRHQTIPQSLTHPSPS